MEIELELTNLRLTIDAFSHMTVGSHQHGHMGYSTPVTNCKNDLLLAKAWLGKALGKIGKDSPYRNDGQRHKVSDIEPTADRNMLVMNEIYTQSQFELKNDIEKIDWMREQIKTTLNLCQNVFEYGSYGDVIGEFIINNVLTHLAEARFWLGFELERLKTISSEADSPV